MTLSRGLVVVALAGLLYFGWVWMKGRSQGATPEFSALIALWAGRYFIEPAAVQAIVMCEQGTLTPPDSGSWVEGDQGLSGGPSYGPMQVLRGGAIAAWEQANGSAADANGSYEYLNTVGNPTAMQIGCWYLAKVLATSPGDISLGFTRYNAGPGAGSVSDYGIKAYGFYQGFGGTKTGSSSSGPAIAEADSAGDDDSGDDSGDESEPA